jgi:hypothetical protein
LELAVELAPQVPDFRQARDLLLQRINQDQKSNRSAPPPAAGKSGGD